MLGDELTPMRTRVAEVVMPGADSHNILDSYFAGLCRMLLKAMHK